MKEDASLRTACTILGHYFSMAHSFGTNAQLCLDMVRDRFWRQFFISNLVILTLVSLGFVILYMGKWQVAIPTSAACFFSIWTFLYMHSSPTGRMRPSNRERELAKKWQRFLKIAYRLGLVHNLADNIRSESNPYNQAMILSENQFGNTWFREKIRAVLRKMVDDHIRGFKEATCDDEPDVAQNMHSQLLNWTREAADLLGIQCTA